MAFAPFMAVHRLRSGYRVDGRNKCSPYGNYNGHVAWRFAIGQRLRKIMFPLSWVIRTSGRNSYRR